MTDSEAVTHQSVPIHLVIFDLANRIGIAQVTGAVFDGAVRIACDPILEISGDISSQVRLLTLFGPRDRF